MRTPHISTIGNMFPLSDKAFREPSYLASMPEYFWCGIVDDAPDLGRWCLFGERAWRRQRSAGSAWLKSRLATERIRLMRQACSPKVHASDEFYFEFLILPGSIGQTRHHSQQFSRRNRLGDIVLVADGEGMPAVFLTPISRQGNGRNMPAALALPRSQFLHQHVTVFLRHADVGDENVRPPYVAGGQGLRRGDRSSHLRAFMLEHHCYKLTRIGVIVHKQRAHTC